MTQRRVIADALAASAITYVGMSLPEAEIRSNLLAMWERLGEPPGAFQDAVDVLPALPQPVDDDAESTARRDQIMEMLGGPTSTEQLSDALSGLEILERLAIEFP